MQCCTLIKTRIILFFHLPRPHWLPWVLTPEHQRQLCSVRSSSARTSGARSDLFMSYSQRSKLAEPAVPQHLCKDFDCQQLLGGAVIRKRSGLPMLSVQKFSETMSNHSCTKPFHLVLVWAHCLRAPTNQRGTFGNGAEF